MKKKQNKITPQPMPKFCVYIASHSTGLHPIHGLRVGVSQYTTNSLSYFFDSLLLFFYFFLSLSCFYCFDEHFLITILCAVCCACMLFCFPQLFYFSRKERKKFFYFYLFPRFFIFFSSWRNGNTIHIDLHLSTSTKIRIKM